MTDLAPIRKRTRTSSAPVAPKEAKPPDVWPNGSELRDGRTGNLLGWTVRNKAGKIEVFRVSPVHVGTAANLSDAIALLSPKTQTKGK